MLHLVVNECGELLTITVTAGNVDDRAVVPNLVRHLFGNLYGDKGYLSQPLFERRWEVGVQLITKLKKNMKERLLPMFDKVTLRKRGIIKSILDQLKNI